jgi:hypothetical protein
MCGSLKRKQQQKHLEIHNRPMIKSNKSEKWQWRPLRMTRAKKNTNKQQDKRCYEELLSPKSGTATPCPQNFWEHLHF